jgi:erythrin-vacuolar iron transport family protein
MKREFTSLTAREALNVAIFIEQRNADIYRQFGELFDGFQDPESCEIAATFWDMAEEEERHGAALQDRYSERYGRHATSISEEEIRDKIEVPKIVTGEIFAIARAQVSQVPRNRAFEIALAAERSAMKFYAGLLETTDDADLRSLYEELASDEDDHVRALQKKIIRGNHTASVANQA